MRGIALSILALTGIILLMLTGSDEAKAACVEKTNGDAHWIALVPDSDADRFADQGFTIAICPDDYADNPVLAEAWCSSFAKMTADRKSRFFEKMGITTDQACQAAKDYFAAR